ncbi:MAG: hypothetical protein J5520_05550 [Bacteroidales bacterium]|nr:hypothetical protein [Bacteroidales bacterium]
MIVPTMTLEEIARQYLGDFPNFVAKRRCFQPKFETLVKRSTRYPVTVQYEYISHTNKNRYFFCYSAFKRSDWKAPHCNVVGVFEGEGGKYAVVSANMKKAVIIFTPHFFARYRERILGGEEIHGDELIKRFFKRNQRFAKAEMDKRFARAYRKYENDESVSYAARVNEGNVFLKIYSGYIVLCKTILSDEMLKDEQVEAFGELKAQYEELKDIRLERFKDVF